jgi:hypothetical protein
MSALVAESVVGVRKHGPGLQYEVKWAGKAETTWDAASRVRRQHPALVQAFELQQQQPPQPQEGVADQFGTADHAVPMEEDAASDVSAMREQVEALQQIVRQQGQQLQLLRISPSQSPQASSRQVPPQPPALLAAAAAAAPTSGSRFAKKEPRAQDLREYDGAAGAKLDAWLDELSLARMLYELNAREASRFAVSRLRGAALQWWLWLDSSAQEAIGSAEALAAALRARFQPVTTARTAREQLDKLTQGSRNVNDYIADFQRLRTQLPSMAEDDALYAFERGLRRELAVELRRQGANSLQEAIALVARVGGLLQAANASPQGRGATANQMDMGDGDEGAGRLDRIEAALNAITSAQGGNASGPGTKTQTQRGYQNVEQSSRGGGRGGRGAGRGGRGGGRGPPVVAGVTPEVVRQRLDARQCLRCGSDEHMSYSCPNSISNSSF